MRWLVIPFLLLVAGCPRTQAVSERNTPSNERQPSEYQQPPPPYHGEAVRYVEECLNSATDAGSPLLEQCWEVIGRLQTAGTAPEMQAVRDVIIGYINEGADPLPRALVSAWATLEPDNGLSFIQRVLEAGEFRYLSSLEYQPELLRKAIAGLDLETLSNSQAHLVIRLLAGTMKLPSSDLPVWHSLSQHPDADVRLRAIGYLMQHGQTTSEQQNQVKQALTSKALDDLAGAIEAVRLSGDGTWAGSLVPLVAQTEMGLPAEDNQRDFRELYGAYALAYLPGAQADHMRAKLLQAADPQIRWQARLGQLLHGDPAPWQMSVAQLSVEDKELWLALEPPEAVHMDLLGTYEDTLGGSVAVRIKAAEHMNRYGAYSSDNRVVQVVMGLLEDESADVRAIAWETAAELDFPVKTQAELVLAQETRPGIERLAAALFLLKQSDRARLATGVYTPGKGSG